MFITEPGPLSTSQPGKLPVSFNPEFLPGREHQQLLQHQHGPRELGVHEVCPLPDQGGKLSQLRVNPSPPFFLLPLPPLNPSHQTILIWGQCNEETDRKFYSETQIIPWDQLVDIGKNNIVYISHKSLVNYCSLTLFTTF